jgi:hypothetical protein
MPQRGGRRRRARPWQAADAGGGVGIVQARRNRTVDTRTLAERDPMATCRAALPSVARLPGQKARDHFLDELRRKVEPDRPVAIPLPQRRAFASRGGARDRQRISRGVQRSRRFRGRQRRGQRRLNGWRVAGLPWRQDRT